MISRRILRIVGFEYGNNVYEAPKVYHIYKKLLCLDRFPDGHKGNLSALISPIEKVLFSMKFLCQPPVKHQLAEMI